MTSTSPPWLPPELLTEIAKRLTDAVDYVAFRGVCKSWRLAAKPSDAPKQQLPWFLLHHAFSSDRRRFYNSCDNRIRVRRSNALAGSVEVGSSFGWLALLAAGGANLSLWNPLTNSTITRLPSLMFLPEKVSLTASPADPACLVLVVPEESSWFAYCHVGDVSWSTRTTKLSGCVIVVVHSGGKFYAFDNEGDGVVCTGEGTIEIPCPQWLVHMLGIHVVEAGGVLYMVQNHLWPDESEEEEQRIDVFKLGFAGGRYSWEESGDIGGSVFFLADNHASVVKASEYPSDHIYFCGPKMKNCELKGDAVFTYDVKKNKFRILSLCEGLLEGMMQSATWVVPSLL